MSAAARIGKSTYSSQSCHLPLAFWALLVLTIALRLPGITRPLLGNFATKNVVYAMIARNWAEQKTTLWYPMVDCMVGGGRGLHMAEFPVSAYVSAACWKLCGGALDVWGRATSVAFMAAAVAVLYGYVRRNHGPVAGFGAGWTMALSPIAIIYGQSFMLDASLVFFTLVTFYGIDRWIEVAIPGGESSIPTCGNALCGIVGGAGDPEGLPADRNATEGVPSSVSSGIAKLRLATKGWGWLLVAASSLALVLLSKCYLAVWLLPLAAMVIWPVQKGQERGPSLLAPAARSRLRTTGRTKGDCTLFLLASVAAVLASLPAVLWYVHAYRSAMPGSPIAHLVYTSLQRNAEGSPLFDRLLGRPDFYRQVLDDLTGVVLTPLGLAFFLGGFIHPGWKRYALWLVAAAALVAILPVKFYKMNYYYVATLPPVCVLAGLGWQVAVPRLRLRRTAVAGLLMVWLVFALRFAVRPAFLTPAQDQSVVAAGRAVQQLTRPDEPIVTMHGDAIDLLYYACRPGWAIAPGTGELAGLLERCARQGARYMAIVDAEAETVAARCAGMLASQAPAAAGDGYRIYRLASWPARSSRAAASPGHPTRSVARFGVRRSVHQRGVPH